MKLNHLAIETLPERIRSKFVKRDDDQCWIWHGAISSKGYGHVYSQKLRKPTTAHRLVYEMLVGPVSGDLVVDHLCRNTKCVNPNHMEPVTPRENILRGVGTGATNAIKTFCKHGHPFEGSRIHSRTGRPSRVCRVCMRIRPIVGLEKLSGIRNASAKLTDAKVRRLRVLRKKGASLRQLAARFGISPRTARLAAIGVTWDHVREVSR